MGRLDRSALISPQYQPAWMPMFAGVSQRGDDRNRTGVNGFAGRCVATPPRRQGGARVARTPRFARDGASQLAIEPLIRLLLPRAISSAGRAPPRQGGGHWFE